MTRLKRISPPGANRCRQTSRDRRLDTEAEQDRAAIWDYMAADDPRAAARLDQLFSDAATRLGEQPGLGRVGSIPGTRELIPHESYRHVYEIDVETVWLLALVYTARQWPPVH